MDAQLGILQVSEVMMMKFMKNKKGIAGNMFTILIAALIAIVVGILIGFIFKGGGEKTVDNLNVQIDLLGDCDSDGVANLHDMCPCLSPVVTGGKEEDSFAGCPDGTTGEQANKDKNSCFGWFVDTNTKETFEKCPEGQTCELRCDYAKKTIAPIGDEEKIKGRVGNFDFVAKKFMILKDTGVDSDGDGAVDFEESIDVLLDLRNGDDGIISLIYEIKNDGDEISTDLIVGLYVCKSDDSNNCNFKNKFKIEGMKAQETKKARVPITIANRGDFCDGSGTKSCRIKIVVDDNNDFNEGLSGETNNEKFVDVQVKNQKLEVADFQSYKTIELSGDIKAEKNIIFSVSQVSKGYIGNEGMPSLVDSKKSLASGCDDEFSQESSPFRNMKGCWVLLSVPGSVSDGCGEVLAKTGKGIDIDGNAIDYVKRVDVSVTEGTYNAGYYSKENDKDPKTLVDRFKWQALAEGSLLCSDNAVGFNNAVGDWWELCNKEHDGKIAKLKNGQEFLCENKKWVSR